MSTAGFFPSLCVVLWLAVGSASGGVLRRLRRLDIRHWSVPAVPCGDIAGWITGSDCIGLHELAGAVEKLSCCAAAACSWWDLDNHRAQALIPDLKGRALLDWSGECPEWHLDVPICL